MVCADAASSLKEEKTPAGPLKKTRHVQLSIELFEVVPYD
jgi:hypothetical protein